MLYQFHLFIMSRQNSVPFHDICLGHHIDLHRQMPPRKLFLHLPLQIPHRSNDSIDDRFIPVCCNQYFQFRSPRSFFLNGTLQTLRKLPGNFKIFRKKKKKKNGRFPDSFFLFSYIENKIFLIITSTSRCSG